LRVMFLQEFAQRYLAYFILLALTSAIVIVAAAVTGNTGYFVLPPARTTPYLYLFACLHLRTPLSPNLPSLWILRISFGTLSIVLEDTPKEGWWDLLKSLVYPKLLLLLLTAL
jgi:hypothetical protein